MTHDGAAPSKAPETSSKRYCLVDGCTADMSTESNYCRHKRVCLAHQRANCLQHAGDKLWRFCQQCGKLEPLAAFDTAKRSCRASLARRRAHQCGGADKKAAAEAAAAAAAAVSEPLAAVSEPLAGLEYIPIMNMPPAPPTGALLEPQAAPAGPMDDAAGAAAAADMTFVATPGVYGAQLDQQLQIYQQKCAQLRMQIQLLEQQHHSQQHTGMGAGGLSPAGLASALQSPTYGPTYGHNTFMGSGQAVGGLGAASGAASASSAGMPMMQSASSTGSMWAPPGTGSNSLLLPRQMSASNSSSVASIGLVSPAAAASMDAAAAAAHSLQQQQQLWQLRQQQQQAMTLSMGPAGQAAGTAAAAACAGMGMASCMSPAGLTPTYPEGMLDSSLCFSGDWAWQQQMMQPPAHVQQMLPAAAYAGASALLPAGWAPSSGPMPVLKAEPQSAASCSGIHSGVLVPVLPHMFEGAGLKAAGAVPAAASGGASARAAAAAGEARCAAVFQPLMMLGEEDGLDLMDCDSAEDIADMLEMSLLEAGMKAQMGGAAGMC